MKQIVTFAQELVHAEVASTVEVEKIWSKSSQGVIETPQQQGKVLANVA